MNPNTKREIERVENSFKRGNISSNRAKQELNSIGVDKIVADRFVRFWTHESQIKQSKE